MESRKLFLKGEIKRLEQLLYNCYDYCLFTSAFEDEKRLKKEKLLNYFLK